VSKSTFTGPLTCKVRSKLPSAANVEIDKPQTKAKIPAAMIAFVDLFMFSSVYWTRLSLNCHSREIRKKKGTVFRAQPEP
jgi:hypothetical protein